MITGPSSCSARAVVLREGTCAKQKSNAGKSKVLFWIHYWHLQVLSMFYWNTYDISLIRKWLVVALCLLFDSIKPSVAIVIPFRKIIILITILKLKQLFICILVLGSCYCWIHILRFTWHSSYFWAGLMVYFAISIFKYCFYWYCSYWLWWHTVLGSILWRSSS